MSRSSVRAVSAWLLMQTLSRLGVGHLLVVDPERVDPTNLPRLPETTWLEAIDYFDRSGVPEPIRREVRADGLLLVARSCTR